ncbi:hypothetical protein C8R45DRAFT_1015141 [Mycena sanguinolenta]|nr:hypothetical protein C8R45DRAFT_1015141 [Mycena sanguinolenta]
MFILPVHAHPFDAASSSFPFSFTGVFSHWQWLLSPLRLALTLLATFIVFCAVRRLLTWRVRIGAKKAVPVSVEKPLSSSPSSSEGGNESEKKRSWRGLLPSVSVNTLAEALPITLSGPPAPPMRGRHVYRGGRGVGFNLSTRRPEAALATKPRVEAPLPAIYESETPASMAKMIMSRHVRPLPLPSFFFSLRPLLPPWRRTVSRVARRRRIITPRLPPSPSPPSFRASQRRPSRAWSAPRHPSRGHVTRLPHTPAFRPSSLIPPIVSPWRSCPFSRFRYSSLDLCRLVISR